MKIRVRFNNLKQSIEVNESVQTINDLKKLISAQIRGLPAKFSLSLNGTSALEDSGGDELLKDVGIVSGDLVHVLSISGSSSGPAGTKLLYKDSKSSAEEGSQNRKFSDMFPSAVEESLRELNQQEKPGRILPMEVESVKNLTEVRAGDEDFDFLMTLSLSLVTSWFEGLTPSPQKLIISVLHCLMSELGYRLACDTGKVEDFDPSMVKMEFVHPSFPRSTFKLFLVTMVNKCILHCSSHASGEVLFRDSMNVDPDQLFGGRIDDGVLATKRFKDSLIVLRKHFRCQIGHNMKQSALRAHGLREMSELSTFPFEVQLKLLHLLDVPDILRLSETSTFWRGLCTEPAIWRRKYAQLIGHVPFSCAQSENWIGLYKEAYKEQKERSRRIKDFDNPFIMPHCHHPKPRPYFNPISGFPFPGVVGGRYDIFPGGLRGFDPDLPDVIHPHFGTGAFSQNPPAVPRPGIGGVGGFDLDSDLMRGPNELGGPWRDSDRRGAGRFPGRFDWMP